MTFIRDVELVGPPLQVQTRVLTLSVGVIKAKAEDVIGYLTWPGRDLGSLRGINSSARHI